MKRGFWILAVVIVLFFPGLEINYFIRLATIMMLYCVLALSWNFIGGLTGYPSFATAAFFGLGAYAGGVAQGQGIPMYIAWIIGAALAALFATGLGLAILRLRGHYFAIASLVVADVLREIVNSTTNLTGGGMGLNLPYPQVRRGCPGQAFLLLHVRHRSAHPFHRRLRDAAAAGFWTRVHQAKRRRRQHHRDQRHHL